MSQLKAKYYGHLGNLKNKVYNSGVPGEWITHPNNGHQFNATNGGCLMWWPSTKTIVLQGKWLPIEEAAIKEQIDFTNRKHLAARAKEASEVRAKISAELDSLLAALEEDDEDTE